MRDMALHSSWQLDFLYSVKSCMVCMSGTSISWVSRHFLRVGAMSFTLSSASRVSALKLNRGVRTEIDGEVYSHSPDLNFLSYSNMDPFPRHLWKLVRIMNMNLPALKEVISGARHL